MISTKLLVNVLQEEAAWHNRWSNHLAVTGLARDQPSNACNQQWRNLVWIAPGVLR